MRVTRQSKVSSLTEGEGQDSEKGMECCVLANVFDIRVNYSQQCQLDAMG